MLLNTYRCEDLAGATYYKFTFALHQVDRTSGHFRAPSIPLRICCPGVHRRYLQNLQPSRRRYWGDRYMDMGGISIVDVMRTADTPAASPRSHEWVMRVDGDKDDKHW